MGDWASGFQTPGFGVGMGLLQMGQERPWNQPMPTGLLQSSLGQAQAGRMQDKRLEAIKAQQQAQQAQQQAQQQAAQQQAQQMRGQVAQVIQAMNTGQMSRGQGMAQLAQIPGAIELLNKAMPQAGTDPMAKFNAWQNLPPEAKSAYGQYRAAERGPGVSVNVGDKEKPIPMTSLAMMVLPNGQPANLPPGTTPSQAAAVGARPMSPDQKINLDLDAKLAWRKQAVEALKGEYQEALAAFKKNPNHRTRRAFNNKADQLQTMMSAVNSPFAEPSDSIKEPISVPGAGQTLINEGTGWILEKLGIGSEDDKLEEAFKRYGAGG